MKKSFFLATIFSFFISTSLLGTNFPFQFPHVEAWFTGPLLAPSGHTLPGGHINWEPYLFVIDSYGFYDNHGRAHSTPRTIRVNPLLSLTIGLNDFMDFQLFIQTIYNQKMGKSAFRAGDITGELGFQALEDKLNSWIPDLRITFHQIIPIGQYQKLDPGKNGTDSTGGGAFGEGISFDFQKLFHEIFGLSHHLRIRTSFSFTYFVPVYVQGLNTYGGGFGTKGTVYPGNAYSAIFSFEYNFTQNWVLAMDTLYVYAQKTRFSGKKGINADGSPATVGNGSLDQWSLAPALEYNFSATVGVIGGVWFTVGGRNSNEFINGVIALNMYY